MTSIPLWELSERPKVSDIERRVLMRRHYCVDVRFESDEPDAEAIPVDPPVCAACGEGWGVFGCATVRALGVLAIAEHELKEAQASVTRLTAAVVDLGASGNWWRDTMRDAFRVELVVESLVIRVGGRRALEEALLKLYRKIVTDLERGGQLPTKGATKQPTPATITVAESPTPDGPGELKSL